MQKRQDKIYLGKDKGGVDFLVVFCWTGEGAGQDSFLYVLKNIKKKEKYILQIKGCKNTKYMKCSIESGTGQDQYKVFVCIGTGNKQNKTIL